MNTSVIIVLRRSPSAAFMYMFVRLTFMDSDVYFFFLPVLQMCR
jgi:hypothetical protein